MPRDRFRAKPDEQYDVVVIGAGVGGLMAATTLAAAGKHVLCVEGHYVAGGCATVFRRKNYEFDIGLHYLGDCEWGGIIPTMLRTVGIDDIEFVPMSQDAFDILVFPDQTFRVPRGIRAFATRLTEQFPSEQAGIDAYASVLETLVELTRAAIEPDRPMPSSELLVRYGRATLSEFFDAYRLSPQLRAHLVGQWGNYGLPPSRMSLTAHAATLSHYLEHGGFYPRGGGQAIADRLAARLEALGGHLNLGTRATKINIENKRATSITLVGKHFPERTVKSACIISNGDYLKTLRNLVGEEHLGQSERRLASTGEMPHGMAILNLGVRREALPDVMEASNYWIWPDYDLERQCALALNGEWDANPCVYATSSTLKDPLARKFAPPGIVNMQLVAVVPVQPSAWGVQLDGFGDHTYQAAASYQRLKEGVTERLITGAERVFPEIRQGIVFRDLATPLSHVRYTDATGGTPYGLASIPDQVGSKRPKVRSSISGLLFCGSSTRRGPGVMPGLLSGRDAATQALEVLHSRA